MKVLIVDNNDQIRRYLNELLVNEGFHTIQAQDGQGCLSVYREKKPDFICLDIVMPDMSGYDVCKEIRKTDEQTPIIFISTKSEPLDKVMGLEIGADDYIIKPFDNHEVVARIRAVARRCYLKSEPEAVKESFTIHNLEVFPKKLMARRGEETIELNLRDIKILQLLKKNANNVLDRDTLLDECWGAHIMPESRTLDWHISQLRKKIENNPKEPEIIKTVHGVGYKYEE
jgi:DNA-binding response OmpR family regulator